MKLVRHLLALLIVVAMAAPWPVVAQDDSTPPLPRPRPDREAVQASESALPGETNVATPATDAISQATAVPQPVHLSAQLVDSGDPIAGGIVWRVFDTRTDATGELALVAKSDQAQATVQLPPGDYVVHAAFGRAEASDSLTVKLGENDKTVVLDAGALRLSAAVTGDIPIPPELLRFDIFSGGAAESGRTIVSEGLPANEVVTLNSGTYHVVSYFGTVNAVVRADLRIEPGQLTDATLFHKAAEVSFKLVSEPGGEAIADVEWTVKTPDGTTVFSDLGAFPATVLAEGDYLVLAKRGDDVFNREFEVVSGPAKEIEVLTTAF